VKLYSGDDMYSSAPKRDTIAVIGDVHGCLKSAQALVAKLPPGVRPVFVGDFIDRGPDSPGVLRWVRENGYESVLANHEDFLLQHFLNAPRAMRYDMGVWQMNGGQPLLYVNEIESVKWLATLPLYLEFADEPKDDTGRVLFVSHACPDEENLTDPKTLLWNRHPPGTDVNRFFVFGHTPRREVMINKQWANVDTGCVHQYTNITKWGKLSALLWPSKTIIEQEYIG
jgi:serine/threonine protein phosphatase 1